MNDGTSFLGKWKFVDTHGKSCEATYPEGAIAEIEPSGGKLKITWRDGTKEHSLNHLVVTDGKLVGPGKDRHGRLWDITIERNDTSGKLKGDVASLFTLEPNGLLEADLAGTWGAEAIHPIEDDEDDEQVR